jgi:hypothetical protein
VPTICECHLRCLHGYRRLGLVESNIARTTSLFQRAPCVDTTMALLELPSTREVELETLLRKREQELSDRTVSSISSTRRDSMLTSP